MSARVTCMIRNVLGIFACAHIDPADLLVVGDRYFVLQ
jgi:hypothetical protein